MVEFRNDRLRSIRPEVRVPGYDRSQLRPGIVHLGVGNFHRVHQATVVDDLGNHFEVNEPQFNDDDWSILKSNDPTALLQTVPFRSLELDHSQRFRELYLGLKLKLASDGTGPALGSILV